VRGAIKWFNNRRATGSSDAKMGPMSSFIILRFSETVTAL